MYESLFDCFKQLLLLFYSYLVTKLFIAGARLLSDVVGGLMLSSDNPLDFHDEI